ncbi:AurF N-oxygenase family protein [Knoellia sp. CPCC 206453]|uniref:AurF N-oxygenase family protein n=1 Tax=Knoellia pratensis TaxID=3404796 RepID=UPI00360680D7
MSQLQTYEEKLQTLSEGSVRVSFNAFTDIRWDDPDYAVIPDDARWVLPAVDPMGGHEWYLSLPLDRQIEIGKARMANIAKVGWQFENILIKGVLEYLVNAPNNSAEFRYLMHEVTEETHHIQMFQELVNRTGADVLGAPRWFRASQSILPVFGRLLPEVFFTGILAGEEPIDHLQKSFLRSGVDVHPVFHRVMQIHVAEEARHISFAHEFLARKVPTLPRWRRQLLAVTYPIIMRVLCDVIARPSRQFNKQFGIPRSVAKEVYWRAPESRKLLRDLFADVRALAVETRLMNPVSKAFWRAMRIDGRPSRFRSEPAPKSA